MIRVQYYYYQFNDLLSLFLAAVNHLKKNYAYLPRISIYAMFVLGCSFNQAVNAAKKEVELHQLSLQELMEVKVALGTMDQIEAHKLPFTYHLITASDIANAPHRDLYDIVATYVPGLMPMSHANNPKTGIRGIISDRNNKLLLLVNGRNITDKALQGAIAELDHWDLNDIEKIEVISGAGAVTYGPGAISGVISITTKTSANTDGTRVGAIGHPTYHGAGVFVEHAFRNEESDFGLYAYLSVVSTDGDDDLDFYQPDPTRTTPYLGQDDSYPSRAQDYRADTFGDDQIKFHLDFDYGDDWRLWARYTRSGINVSRRTKITFADGDGSATGYSIESFVATLAHQLEVTENAVLKSMLAYDTHSNIKATPRDLSFDSDEPINRSNAYSENEIFLQSIFSSSAVDERLSYAIGAEFSYETIRAPWGEGRGKLLLKDEFSLISGDDSVYADAANNRLDVGSGIDIYTYSFLGEFSYNFNDTFTAMAAGRYDKNEYADGLISPRVAFVAEFDQNVFKLIWQESSRLTSTSLLYAADTFGNEVDPEMVTNFEFIYSRLQNENIRFDVSAYFSEIDIIGWSTDRTASIGDLELWGTDLELTYQTDQIKFWIGHSYTKEIDFKLGKDYDDRQGISFSDYNFNGNNLNYRDQGSDLNNWSNHMTKLAVSYKLNRWALHANVQVYWGYPGSLNELDVFDAAYASLSAAEIVARAGEIADYEKERAALKDKDAFELNTKVNLGVSRSFGKDDGGNVWLGVQNLFSNYRDYGYSTGSKLSYPDRMRWSDEPGSIHLRVTAKF